MTKKFLLKTFGCKVNQYETQAIRESLEKTGAREVTEGSGSADLVIVNTCTVTGDADRANRNWIRRLKREYPECRLVVTGCFAETDRDVLERMPEVDMIFSNQGKNRIAEVLTGGGHGSCPGPASQGTEFLPLEIAKSDGRTRANVKIQDGCNHSCSYCKVVLARGRSRSRPPRDVLEEVRRLRDAGYREIILTGIQLGAYGLEKGNEGALAELIRDCAEFEGIERIRLSSVEPTDIRESLIGAFREVPKLCPHVHIPLQSGDDAVLKQMNRRYSPSLYIETISKLREAVPDFCLSLDVMVGFPGETEDAFLKSLEVLKNVRPLKSHIFPFSRRKGTRADRLKILPGTVVRERVRRISEWSGQISAEVREEFLGREFKVLAEHRDPGTGCWEGYAPNYLRVFFDFPRDIRGCIIPVILRDLCDDGCLGDVQGSDEGG